jgi:hypothetical protein
LRFAAAEEPTLQNIVVIESGKSGFLPRTSPEQEKLIPGWDHVIRESRFVKAQAKSTPLHLHGKMDSETGCPSKWPI